MKQEDFMFIDRHPSLDLHGYDRESARVMVNDFILDNVKMKNEIIVIIHGVGSGVVRNATWKALSKNKYVLDYKSDYMNKGCTVVKINVHKN